MPACCQKIAKIRFCCNPNLLEYRFYFHMFIAFMTILQNMCRIQYIIYLACILCLHCTLNAQDVFDIELFATELSAPLDIQNMGDSRLFIVEKGGRIRILDELGNINPDPFLDIRNRVNSQAGERGLLGLAFHPDYVNNGLFFVNYTNLAGNTVIAKYSRLDEDHADPASEGIILTVNQPFANHNGGGLAFGPDQYLYASLGDGGDGGDPGDRAQNPQSLLGKLLRIDVTGDSLYTIPSDNPFAGDDGYLDEIWALGLRNPWRFSFDRQTNDLYIADVGQNAFEEINVQPAGSEGGENYGWRCYEANQPFNLTDCPADTVFSFPVHAYAHQGSSCRASVTGGYVYRGNAQTRLFGSYVFGDYCKGWIARLYRDEMDIWQREDVVQVDVREISSFGENADGELFFSAIGEGEIYRIVPAPVSAIEQIGNENPFHISPNPAKDKIRVVFDDLKQIRIEYKIFDLGGKEVCRGIKTGVAVIEIPLTINVSESGGIFILQLQMDDLVYYERLFLAN